MDHLVVVPLAEGQELGAGSHDIDALAWQSRVVRPLLGDRPKELRVGRPWGLGPLIALDFIGGGNEVPRELLEEQVGPDKLSVE